MGKKQKIQQNFNLEKHMALIFILPCVIILISISVFPFIYSLFLSLNSWQLATGGAKKFIWLANYGRLFTEPRFWNSMWNMGKELIFGVTSQFVIGLLLALALNRIFRTRSLITTLFLLPMMIPPVVVGCNWRQIYHFSYGPLNYILRLFHISNEGLNWLGSVKLSMPSIIISDTWEWTPFMMIVLLAGIQSIPVDLYEVARVCLLYTSPSPRD